MYVDWDPPHLRSAVGYILPQIAKILEWTSNRHLAHIDGLVQDCRNSIANAQELLQACTKPRIYALLSLNELMDLSECSG